MRWATPTLTAAMWMRPLSSTFMAVLKPWPSFRPMRLAAGTRTLSKNTSQVWAPFWPILTSFLPKLMPGLLASTMKAETPPAPLLAASVRAISVNMPAWGALVMKRLLPLTT
ncbi:hypothetical protein D3C80_1764780 [compost metagenome]